MSAENSVWEKIGESLRKGRPTVCATVVGKSGAAPAYPGSKMLIFPNGETFGTIGGGAFESKVIDEAPEIFKSGLPKFVHYSLDDGAALPGEKAAGMICGGKASVFLEPIVQADCLAVFGGGHVGRALANMAGGLNFSFVCIEDRPDIRENFAAEFGVPAFESLEAAALPDNSFLVLAGYSHERDYQILLDILKSGLKFKYLGLVASAAKWKNFQSMLTKDLPNAAGLENIFSPAGLNTGGRSPGDIALSILAQIGNIRYNCGTLRNLNSNA